MLLAPTFAKPSFPYRYHVEQNIDEHQVGSVDIAINADGSGIVKTTFSNGKKVAGNTFSSATGFFGQDKKPFLVVVQTKGLDGSLLHNGKTQEGIEEQQIHLSPRAVASPMPEADPATMTILPSTGDAAAFLDFILSKLPQH